MGKQSEAASAGGRRRAGGLCQVRGETQLALFGRTERLGQSERLLLCKPVRGDCFRFLCVFLYKIVGFFNLFSGWYLAKFGLGLAKFLSFWLNFIYFYLKMPDCEDILNANVKLNKKFQRRQVSGEHVSGEKG